jgi:hypothetical protein
MLTKEVFKIITKEMLTVKTLTWIFFVPMRIFSVRMWTPLINMQIGDIDEVPLI